MQQEITGHRNGCIKATGESIIISANWTGKGCLECEYYGERGHWAKAACIL